VRAVHPGLFANGVYALANDNVFQATVIGAYILCGANQAC